MTSGTRAIVAATEALSQADYRLIRLQGLRASGECTCGREDCTSPGKHPLPGEKVSLCAERYLRLHPGDAQRFTRTGMNLGIRTGGPLLVLDFDGADGALTYHLLCPAHPELATAPTVMTGNGFHLYLQVPAELQRSVRTSVRLRPGLDTRYDRAYVVAPPSMHVSGTPYTWQSGPVAVADLPPLTTALHDALFSAPTAPKTPAPSWTAQRWSQASLIDTALQRYGEVGARHDGAVWLAVRAASSGVPESTALEWADAYASCVSEPQSFSAQEARAAVAWAYRTSLQSGAPSVARRAWRTRGGW